VRDLTLTAAPNPFNPVTEITFSLPWSGHARLAIHDLRGRRIATLADGLYPAGEHRVRWHARDEHGAAVASGVYYIRLVGEDEVRVKKITLLQ
jgi:flagellar hook assembly protein FlgD